MPDERALGLSASPARRAVAAPGQRGLASVFALYLLHGLNIGLPILTLPFLTRSLGSEAYGAYGLLMSWIGLATIAIEFGYGIHGTRLLANRPQGSEADARQDAAVLAAVVRRQLAHAAVCLPVLALVLGVTAARGTPLGALAIGLTLLATLSNALSPLWLYVAQRQVGVLLVPTLAAKLTFLALVAVALPRWPSLELALAAVLISYLWILAPLWQHRQALAAAVGDEHRLPPMTSRAGWAQSAIPIQRLGSTLYTNLPVMLAAAWFGLAAAGCYFLADRLVRGAVGLYTPLTSHLLPLQLQAQQAAADAAGRRRLRSMLLLVLVAAGAGAAALAGLSPWLVALLGGEAFAASATLLAWLAPITLLSTANALLINHLYGRSGETTIALVVWLASGVYLVALFGFGRASIELFTALGMAVEGLITAGLLLALRRPRHRAA